MDNDQLVTLLIILGAAILILVIIFVGTIIVGQQPNESSEPVSDTIASTAVDDTADEEISTHEDEDDVLTTDSKIDSRISADSSAKNNSIASASENITTVEEEQIVDLRTPKPTQAPAPTPEPSTEEVVDLRESSTPTQDIRQGNLDLSQYPSYDCIWTCYCLCYHCCEKYPSDPYYGVTSSGYKITPGIGEKVIAVDPNVIPLGSWVYVEILDEGIEDYGYALAADTGGAIDGYHVDLYIDAHSGEWYGKGNARVYVISTP